MKTIVEEAHKKRFKIEDEDPKKKAILISESWMAELQKHPYYSSKPSQLILAEKPGTGIFLMKEHAKLYKAHKSRVRHSLSSRLGDENQSMLEESKREEPSQKRKNLGDGKWAPAELVPSASQTSAAKK